jgi:chorismate-pyruvate lyase
MPKPRNEGGSVSVTERDTLFAASSSPWTGPGTPPWLTLLERFYRRAALPPPSVRQLRGDEVPPPYHSLLVHSSDMTPTLEQHYGQPMGLAVLSRELQDNAYLREVVLKGTRDGAPVEYGVIRICLDHLPPPAARRVLEELSPLGNILQTESIAHMSWPQAFFRADADAHMQTVLGLRQPQDLYGRRNVLVDGSRRLIAEVIEILAPVNQRAAGVNGHERVNRVEVRGSKSGRGSNDSL